MPQELAAIQAVHSGTPAAPVNQVLHVPLFGSPGAEAPTSRSWGELSQVSKALDGFSDRIFNKVDPKADALMSNIHRINEQPFSLDASRQALSNQFELQVHVAKEAVKFHMHLSLANSATGLFNTLLKNRD